MTRRMLPRASFRIAFFVALGIIGCATSVTPGQSDLATEPEPEHAALPPSSSSGGNGTTPTGKGTDPAGKDAGSKHDAAPPPPPPPPPPKICINEAGPPLAVQTECGCDKDCTTGLVCETVGALLHPWCCAAATKPCADINDCCGQLLCKSGTCQ